MHIGSSNPSSSASVFSEREQSLKTFSAVYKGMILRHILWEMLCELSLFASLLPRYAALKPMRSLAINVSSTDRICTLKHPPCAKSGRRK
jgi:hypothetical protein